ncbi:hypothetical protein A6R73_09980 [Xanthomonas translucens pv. poae]|uniref:Pyrrolo-quinoline quinone repeat domain-containing protein n=1 Tax=Xanthomonas graminis pv. poae TaxID=227946 RepID=A0A199P947_9XANT|nr:hypothetical protein [Xanthomonas translucens]OAX57535.1 hypothetical protein A6R73_09980 [Xanthomonas translucens pv. poae]
MALELHSGRRVWAQQLVHHDLWDAKPACGQATPSVYAVGCKQSVGIAAGGREGMGTLGDDVVAYTLDGQGKEVVFQHGMAARMATLGIVALGLLAIVVALWWHRRRRARAGSRGNG